MMFGGWQLPAALAALLLLAGTLLYAEHQRARVIAGERDRAVADLATATDANKRLAQQAADSSKAEAQSRADKDKLRASYETKLRKARAIPDDGCIRRDLPADALRLLNSNDTRAGPVTGTGVTHGGAGS